MVPDGDTIANQLQAGSSYGYAVTALAANGVDFASSGQTSSLLPNLCATMPSVPADPSPLQTDVTCNGTTPQVQLNWTGGGNVSHYRVLRTQGVWDAIAIRPSTITNYNDATVAAEANYSYQVEAYGPGGMAISNIVPVTTPDCTVPLGFTVNEPLTTSCAGENQPTVTLTWNASANADYYEVWRDGVKVSPTNIISPLSFIDTGLTDSQAYNYTVKAVINGGGTTNATNAPVNITAANCAKPDPPDSFTATAQCAEQTAEVLLDATDSTPSSNVTHYEVYRSDDLVTPIYSNPALPTASLHAITNEADKGQSFTYTAYAVAGTIQSNPLTVQNVIADWCDAATPTGVTATPQCTGNVSEVKIDWVMANETNLDGFTIVRDGADLPGLLTATARSFTNSSLTGNTLYNYDVRAESKSTNTGYDKTTAASPVMTYTCTTPQPAANLTVTSECSGSTPYAQITSVASPSEGNNQIQNYGVWRVVGAEDTIPGTDDVNPGVDDDVQVYLNPTVPVSVQDNDPSLTVGNTYSWYIAVQGHNNVWSAKTYHIPSPLTIDACAPGGFNLTITGETCIAVGSPQVTLDWTDSLGAIDYDIERDAGSIVTGHITPTDYPDTTVTADGTPHTYLIVANNAAGTRQSDGGTPKTSSIDCRLPDTPTLDSLTPACDSVSVAFSSGGQNTENYKIYRDGVSVITVGLPGTYVNNALAEQTAYTYHVCAVGGYSLGEYCSGSQVVTTLPCQFAVSLFGSCLAENTPRIVVSWPAQTGVDSYEIFRSTNGGAYNSIGTRPSGSTAYTDDAITNNDTYAYYVRAWTGTVSVDSTTPNPSLIANCTLPDTPPLAVPTPQCTSQTSEAVLDWTGVDTTNIASYNIYKWLSTETEPATPTSVDDTADTSYTDGILTGGATYNYRVQGVGPLGLEGPKSAPQQVIAAHCTPVAPDIVQVTASCNAADPVIDLVWDPDATWADSYEITRNAVPLATVNSATVVTASMIEGEIFLPISGAASDKATNVSIDGRSVRRIGYGMWYSGTNTNEYGSYYTHTFGPSNGPYEFIIHARNYLEHNIGSEYPQDINFFLDSQNSNSPPTPLLWLYGSSNNNNPPLTTETWELHRKSSTVTDGADQLHIACGHVSKQRCNYYAANTDRALLFDKITIAQANWQDGDPLLNSNTTYTYGIKALGTAGPSGITTAAPVTTPACTPYIPTITAVTGSCVGPIPKVTVQWTVPSAQPGVTYKLYREDDVSAPIYTLADNGNTAYNYTDTGGLVGYWTFDAADIVGTAVPDASGQGNDGVLINGPIATAGYGGQADTALEFDGVNDYMEIIDPEYSSPTASWSIWIYMDSISSWKGIIDHGGYKRFSMTSGESAPDAGKIIAHIVTDTSASVSLPTAILPNTWYHVAVTYDKQNLKLYLDSVEQASIPHTSDLGVAESWRDTLIGKQFAGSTYWPGKLDDVRIYNYALSPTEVADLYAGSNVKKINQNTSYTYHVVAEGPGVPAQSLPVATNPDVPWCDPNDFSLIDAVASCRADYADQGSQTDVTWQDPQNALSYEVYRAQFPNVDTNDPGNLIDTSLLESYTDRSVQLGQEYYYRIKALSNGADKTSLDELRANAPNDCALPPTALDVMAVADCGVSGVDFGVTLTVTVPDALEADYVTHGAYYGFMVQRCEAGGTNCAYIPFPENGSVYKTFASVGKNASDDYEFTLVNSQANHNGGFTSNDDVALNTFYEYTVIPFNTYVGGPAAGTSYPTASATTLTLSACGLGDIVHASAQMCIGTTPRVESIWQDLAGVDGYQVVRHTGGVPSILKTLDGGTITIPENTLLAYVDGGPQEGVTYHYEVQSVPVSKTSDPYPDIVASCDEASEQNGSKWYFGQSGASPTAQLRLTDNCSAGTSAPAISIWWQEAGEDDPSQYYLLYKEWFGDAHPAISGYCYNTTSQTYEDSYTICAAASDCSGGALEGTYCRKLSLLEFSGEPRTDANPYVDSGVYPGEWYTYKVIGYFGQSGNPDVLWEKNNIQAPNCLPLPDPFTLDLVQKSCVGTGSDTPQMTFTWNDTTNTNNYAVHYAQTGGGSSGSFTPCLNDWSNAGGVGCTDPAGISGDPYILSAATDSLNSAEVYDFWVVASGGGGQKDSTCAVSGACAMKPPICTAEPNAPTAVNVQVQTYCDRITVSWTIASPNYAESHRLYRCEGASCDPLTDATSVLLREETTSLAEFTDTVITPGTDYNYQVVAHNTRGDAPSAVMSIQAAACAQAAQGLRAIEQCPDQITLEWDEDAGVEGYTISRKLLTDTDYTDPPLVDGTDNADGTCGNALDCTTVAGKIRWIDQDPTLDGSTRYVYKVESVAGGITGNALESQARACSYLPKWKNLLPNF